MTGGFATDAPVPRRLPKAHFRRIFGALLLAAFFTWACPAAASAESKRDFDIPAGRLTTSVIELGKQAQTPIAILDKPAEHVRAGRLRGRFSVRDAVRRLLAGTGYSYRTTAAGDFVIFRSAPRPVRRAKPAFRRPTNRAPIPPGADEEIVIIASKGNIFLQDYPGQISILDDIGTSAAGRPGVGSAAIVDRLPVLAMTNLGPGRNKLYARGIADGSFNGQSQSNIGIYWGDLRLGYSGPDPDLQLVDVRRVEVLTGPYGTLYGAGALGGIIRVEPNAPVLNRPEGQFTAGLSAVRHGETGENATGVLNIPIVADKMALRAVAYRLSDPGYIDDTMRRRSDINSVVTRGARATLRFETGPDLAVSLGIISQTIKADDIQYTNVEESGLSGRSARAQPYSSDILLPNLTITRTWSDLTLNSATGWSRRRSAESNDFEGLGMREKIGRVSMVSHETRLFGHAHSVRLITGFSFVSNRFREDVSTDTFIPLAARPRYRPSALRYWGRTTDVAFFGEAGFALSDGVEATIGGRLSYIGDRRRNSQIHCDGLPDCSQSVAVSRSSLNFLPSVALTWKPSPAWGVYAAYRTGRRGGNLLPILGSTEVIVSRPDYLRSFEVGLRYADSEKFSGSATLSYSKWSDIQSDIPTRPGGTRSVNIGSAGIIGFEAALSWRPTGRLSVTATAFLNDSPSFRVNDEAIDMSRNRLFADGNRLPNVSSVGLRGALAYEFPALNGRMRLSTALRYYGGSRSEYRSRQGSSVETGFEARFKTGPWALTLGVTNLADLRGNRFGLGNPFGLGKDGRQYTPLQPRTISLGFGLDF